MLKISKTTAVQRQVSYYNICSFKISHSQQSLLWASVIGIREKTPHIENLVKPGSKTDVLQHISSSACLKYSDDQIGTSLLSDRIKLRKDFMTSPPQSIPTKRM